MGMVSGSVSLAAATARASCIFICEYLRWPWAGPAAGSRQAASRHARGGPCFTQRAALARARPQPPTAPAAGARSSFVPFLPAHQTMPPMATQMPATFLGGMLSPKNTTPPDRMITVLTWPTTL